MDRQIETLINDRWIYINICRINIQINIQTDRNIDKLQMDSYKYMQNRYIDKYIDKYIDTQKH